MSKFKVGDIIKANEKSNSAYCYTNQERNWTGKILSIENGLIYVETITPEEDKGEKYHLLEKYFDLEKCFDIEENRQNITQIVNENAIIVKLRDGRKGVAKCSQDDKFNLAFGTALAVARAYGDKETEAKLLTEPVKEEPKFKIGELVRIRQWNDMEKEFGTTGIGSVNCKCQFTTEMKPLCGKYAEIKDIRVDGIVFLHFFNCEKEDKCWSYSTDMIEKVD